MPKTTIPLRRRKIRLIDGNRVRNIFPDLYALETFEQVHSPVYPAHAKPFVPAGEIWVDRAFKKELPFLLDIYEAELRRPNWAGPKLRTWLKTHFTEKTTPMPTLTVSERRFGGLKIKKVRGAVVRKWIDPWFIFGGHHYVYDYIPKDEVWMDDAQDKRDYAHTLKHELHERALMAKGVPYDDLGASAHESALDAERGDRRKKLAGKGLLKMKPFRQTPSHCGPASIKIACSYFGLEYAEKFLAERCGTTKRIGTFHFGMLACATAIRATTYSRSGGTIAELRDLVMRRRLPVIVGWYSTWRPPAGDHYSVVCGVTKTHVHLMDPEAETGRRRIPIKTFLQHWWDTDGPETRRVDRWFMTIDFGKMAYTGPNPHATLRSD